MVLPTSLSFFVTAITAKRRWLRGRNASIASRQSGLRPSLNALHHPASLSLENLGSGQSPVSRRLLLVQALALPHGLLTVNEDRVCIMNNAVADRISQNGVGQLVSPSGNVELRAQDGGSSPVTRFHDFKQITASLNFRNTSPSMSINNGLSKGLCPAIFFCATFHVADISHSLLVSASQRIMLRPLFRSPFSNSSS